MMPSAAVRLAVAVGLAVGIFGRESAGVAAARNNPNHFANDAHHHEQLRRLGHDEPTPSPSLDPDDEETVAIVDGQPRQIDALGFTDEPTGTLTPEPTGASDVVDQMIMEEFEEMAVPTPRPTEFRVVTTDEPTGDSPWWQPTRKPTKRPTPRPTRRPTPRPTPAPVRPTPSPTRKIDAIMNNVKETLEPTSEPTADVGNDGETRDGVGDDDSPIVLDRWVRVNLKSVPASREIMNNLQIVAFEDVAAAFLADLFQLTVPVVYDVALEVTGQKMLEGSRRRNRNLSSSSSLRALQKDKKDKEEEAEMDETEPEEEPEEEEDLNTLQVDLRISGRFDPTDVHRAADDVNFDSMCRNFFTVNGGAVVSQLGALADQAMEEGTDGLDGSGLEYFATVQEIRGVTPPAGGFGAGTDADPNLPNADDGGNSNQLAYIIAIAVGSVAFVALVGTMFYIARRNKRNKRDARRNEERSSSKRSKSQANGSRSAPSKKYSPKKSKQSNAALSMMTDEERADALPPGAIDSPEEAQSEVGSLARFHTLEADDYQYSLEDGLGKSGKSPRSPGPLFKKRSNDNGMEYDGNGNTNDTGNLYSPTNDDRYDDHDDDHDEDGFGDAADDATFSEFGKMLSSPGTFNVGNVFDSKSKRNGGADEYRQKDSMMNLSPSTAGFGSPAIPEEPEEKPKKKKKKKKTFGASARRSNGASALNTSGEWSADDSSATQENAQLEQQKNSTLGDLSIDGSAAAHGNKDPLSPDADAWLYETITDVLDDGQSAKSGRSGRSSKSGSPEKAFSKKKKSKKSRSKFSPMAVPEDDVAEDTTIPKPMEYTPGGDDKSVMTTVTKLEDAGMVRRECYAPPGKLGVVIDSTSKGPVVHEVKGGSPLEGIVFPGDRIIAIDGEDTRTLPASAVTKIMAAKKDQQRRMTLLSVVTGIEG